jgi:hypothetical protein
MTQAEIAAHFGTSQKVVCTAMRKCGIPARVAYKRDQRREKNSYWRGGRVLVAKAKRQRGERSAFGNGYFYVIMPDHPNANKSGYVAEHTLVATKTIGRALKKGECVHHVNLQKHDNRPENLVVVSHKKHSEMHNQLEEIAVSLMAEGRVAFDPQSGYRLAQVKAADPGE